MLMKVNQGMLMKTLIFKWLPKLVLQQLFEGKLVSFMFMCQHGHTYKRRAVTLSDYMADANRKIQDKGFLGKLYMKGQNEKTI